MTTHLTPVLRSICLALPEVREERAWVGTRWQVRGRTFAHVLRVEDGWPPAYARAAGGDGPMDLLMFRSCAPELDALRSGGALFFAPPWRPDEVGLVLAEPADWGEVAELVTDSYRCRAPARLAALVDAPPTPG